MNSCEKTFSQNTPTVCMSSKSELTPFAAFGQNSELFRIQNSELEVRTIYLPFPSLPFPVVGGWGACPQPSSTFTAIGIDDAVVLVPRAVRPWDPRRSLGISHLRKNHKISQNHSHTSFNSRAKSISPTFQTVNVCNRCPFLRSFAVFPFRHFWKGLEKISKISGFPPFQIRTF